MAPGLPSFLGGPPKIKRSKSSSSFRSIAPYVPGPVSVGAPSVYSTSTPYQEPYEQFEDYSMDESYNRGRSRSSKHYDSFDHPGYYSAFDPVDGVGPLDPGYAPTTYGDSPTSTMHHHSRRSSYAPSYVPAGNELSLTRPRSHSRSYSNSAYIDPAAYPTHTSSAIPVPPPSILYHVPGTDHRDRYGRSRRHTAPVVTIQGTTSSYYPSSGYSQTSTYYGTRRIGWFDRMGNQLWDNNGSYKPPRADRAYPPDLRDYPDNAWMNEHGVMIEKGTHRMIR